jgi:DNA-binding HxlR family transcriptional regulator
MIPRKPKTDQQRLPKKKRAKKPPAFQMTERDIELVRALAKYRYLLIDQIDWLFPDSSKDKLTRRLNLLFHHGYLNREKLAEVGNQYIYGMREKGARLLSEHDDVTRDKIAWKRHQNQVKPAHIRHLLDVNSAVIAFDVGLTEALKNREIDQYLVRPGSPKSDTLSVIVRDRDGARKTASVVPDGILGIKFNSGEIGIFFIEVERGTIPPNRWENKIAIYREYARSEDLLEKFRTKWFIVLTITSTEQKLRSRAKSTVLAGGKRAFWYTTADRISPDTVLDDIWVRAIDLYSIRNEMISERTDIPNPFTNILTVVGG